MTTIHIRQLQQYTQDNEQLTTIHTVCNTAYVNLQITKKNVVNTFVRNVVNADTTERYETTHAHN